MRLPPLAALMPITLMGALPAHAQTTGLSPFQIGDIFCTASLADDMAPVMGLLTADFKATIDEAQAKNDALAAANPDEKPPLGDGLPWREYPDYADGCTVGTVSDDAVTINYSFSASPDANYSNSLRLEQVDMFGRQVWRIVNVDFSSTDAGTMRQSIFEAVSFN